MNFLATTNNGIYLIQNGKVTSIFLKSHALYGLTWNKEEIFLYSRSKGKLYNWDGYEELNVIESPRVFDGHQILWWNGNLYITNTGKNKIDIWLNKKNFIEWNYAPKFNGEDHINSIYSDHTYFYICEHRYGKLPVYIRVFDTQLNEITEHEFSNIRTDHNCGLHNIYVEDNKLYTLSVNNLIVRNLKSKKEKILDIRSHKDIGYLRGFARCDNFFVIGESRVCASHDRRKGNSNVIILNNNLKIIDCIELENSGQLHDLRLLEDDRAHNSIICPKTWRKTKH